MTMSDPIADMLTRIRNANTAKHDTVDVPASKIDVYKRQIVRGDMTSGRGGGLRCLSEILGDYKDTYRK